MARDGKFGLPWRDYPERATAGNDLAAEIDAAYREIRRDRVLSYLDERDVERGVTREQAAKALIVGVCFLVAAAVVIGSVILQATGVWS